jgi:small subunit ribosomal protein S21
MKKQSKKKQGGDSNQTQHFINNNNNEPKRQPKKTKVDGTESCAVKVIDGNIEMALKIFKKVVRESGRIQELRDRQMFIKPSVKKRETKNKAKFYNQVDVKNEKEASKGQYK